ncbi:MAG: LemA family protein [Ramlibacter sp.]|nr:LemA family protein [Ramlibacter sp.]
MTLSLVLWCVAAILLFWSVGAYNRLVRLRAQANAAFAVLDEHWTRQIGLVHASLPDAFRPSQFTQPGDLVDDLTQLWAGLRGAATQFEASLAALRPHPLDAGAGAALAAAQDVLFMAWQRVESEAHDLAGAPLPETVVARWQALMRETTKAQSRFNEAVTGYNFAIAQFPALLLAWLFSFKPASTL